MLWQLLGHRLPHIFQSRPGRWPHHLMEILGFFSETVASAFEDRGTLFWTSQQSSGAEWTNQGLGSISSLDFWAPCRMLLKRAENWMKLEVSTCFNLVHRCLRRSIHQILVDACNSLSIAGFGVRYVDVAWGSAGCFLCQPLPLFKARTSSIKLVKPDTRTNRAQASDPQKSSNDIKCANHLPFMSGLLTGNGRGSLEGFCLSLCEPTLLEDFDREVARHGSAKQRKAT